MRARTLFSGLRSACLIWLAMGSLLGCSWKDLIPTHSDLLPNAEAVDHALDLCSITRGGEPFHLRLEITPPVQNSRVLPGTGGMHAQIEVWWLNAITYRTEIHSPAFSQTRIVNGPVIEEHDMGSFYPRWLQNFVDALFDPVPRTALLRRQQGSIPISTEAHACIANPAGLQDETAKAEMCFQGEQPLLASGVDFTRYVAFDDFRAFGSQLIPRTLINDLPANVLVRGHVVVLEPLSHAAYPLLKATRFTPLTQQIQTRLVSKATAEALLNRSGSSDNSDRSTQESRLNTGVQTRTTLASRRLISAVAAVEENKVAIHASGHATIYIRTDRTGRVREAYTDSDDVYGLHKAAAARTLGMRFRPLIANGAAVQMEAPIEIDEDTDSMQR